MLLTPLQRIRASGMSLVDVMFAISLVSFASASLFLLYSNSLQMLRGQADTEAATLCLQERAEQVRNLNWDQISSAASLTSLLANSPSSARLLPSLTEDLTVSVYPASASTPLHLRRSPPAGAVTTVAQPSDSSLANATLVRVDLRATWTDNGRAHIRENSLLLSPGGRQP